MSPGRVVVAGGTGFIGRALCERLQADGFEVVALAWAEEEEVDLPGENVEIVEWRGKTAEKWGSHADGAVAIINLAGENISTERWTPEKKNRILRSRVDAARAVVQAVKWAGQKPAVVIQGSAISFYGRHRDEIIDESWSPGEGFFPEVVQKMEAAAKAVETLGVRFVALRTGVVLGRDGGLVPGMVRSFRNLLGGPTGSGRQWVSWIHIFDEVAAIRFLMDREDLHGAFNLTAPDPLRQKELSRALGKVLGRPCWLPTPGWWLRLKYGEMAEAVMLSGARVLPARLLSAGFQFEWPDIESAIREIRERTVAPEGSTCA
jgi:uncharacterized protein (TIGR01777 family)